MAPFPSRTPRSRSAFVAGLLLLALGLAGLLAYQAHDAARSHRAVAEKALGEHAAFAAWEYTGVLRRDIFVKAVAPGMDLVGSVGGKDPGVPLGPAARADSLATAWGWPHEGTWDYLFRLDIRRGTVEWLGAVEPTAGELAWIRDSLTVHAARVYDPDWEHSARLVPGPDGPRFLAYRLSPRADGGAEVAYGFRSDLGTHHYLFRKIVDAVPLLPPSLTNGHRTPELLSVRVEAPGGDLLFASEPQYESPFLARDTLGAVFGGLQAQVSIRPDAAGSLVIGGLPRSRLPLIAGLLLLTAGLLAAAILQLRREYELAVLRADFVSGVSHELRTPVAQIRMFAETLLLGRIRSDEERTRSLEIIVKEVRRLTHQVDNVLLFSRAEREGIRLCPELLDLSALVRETAESFAPVAAAAGSRLDLHVEEGIRARVDPTTFPQALTNLLDNAVKYGPPGQAVRLSVASLVTGGAQVAVEDRGPGIPREDRGRIWEPYHRLERDRDSAVAGSGIGLAVVREVVMRMGGTIRIEAPAEGGTRFIMEVPGAGRTGPGDGMEAGGSVRARRSEGSDGALAAAGGQDRQRSDDHGPPGGPP